MTKREKTSRVVLLVPVLATLALAQLYVLARTIPSAMDLFPTLLEQERTLLLAGQVFALLAVAVLIWRCVLVALYRPVASVPDSELPEVTVIVPAYNEGQQVFKTLESLVHSDYPTDKLRIVAVDDGSVDDTWTWMDLGRARFEGRVMAIRCPKNRGKRAALYEGFKHARGSVIVTVDSDSEVTRETLRSLVSPFVVDARVGGVAGNVRVLNETGGPIAKMLDVSFTFAFEFMRASESMVDTVMCCPGALSAYRRELIEACKDEWVEQTFLGRPANIGEDRALTNAVLAMGYLVRFQSNAIVLTEVPTKLPQLSRMLLRWARSNVRETLAMGAFVFKRFRRSSALGARINFVWSALGLVVGAVAFVPTLFFIAMEPQVLPFVMMGTLLSGVVPAAIYAASRASLSALWAFPYSLFFLLCLSWIGPYGFVTPQRSKWLTRELPSSGGRLPLTEASTNDAIMAAE